jgi:hypothetical protein
MVLIRGYEIATTWPPNRDIRALAAALHRAYI